MLRFQDYFREAMMTPQTLPPNVIVKIYKVSPNYIVIRAFDQNENEKQKARIDMHKTPIGQYWTVHQKAEHGYGPFLYDISIEYATKMGSGVVPAKGAFTGQRKANIVGDNTQESSNVWKYYFTNRKDVNHSLPPEIEKEINQNNYEMYYYKATPWLFQVYRKEPIFIRELLQNKKLVFGRKYGDIDPGFAEYFS